MAEYEIVGRPSQSAIDSGIHQTCDAMGRVEPGIARAFVEETKRLGGKGSSLVGKVISAAGIETVPVVDHNTEAGHINVAGRAGVVDDVDIVGETL